MKVAKELAKEAQKLGICQEWHDELKALKSKQAMIEMYIKGIDFCLSNNYPSNDYIRVNFKGVMEDFGVFLDDNISVTNIPNCVALGNSVGNFTADGYVVSRVFVKHNSRLNINAYGNAFVLVDVFDNAKIRVSTSGNSKVCIYLYGDECHADVTQSEQSAIKIINKQSKTY